MHGWRAVSGVYGERQRYVRCQEGVRDRGEVVGGGGGGAGGGSGDTANPAYPCGWAEGWVWGIWATF